MMSPAAKSARCGARSDDTCWWARATALAKLECRARQDDRRGLKRGCDTARKHTERSVKGVTPADFPEVRRRLLTDDVTCGGVMPDAAREAMIPVGRARDRAR